MITAIPALDPTSPTFKADVNTFFQERFPQFTIEINEVVDQLNGAEASELAAASSASAAKVAADAAAMTANVTGWVSGATYAKGVAAWSPINLQTYRRIVAGAGTIDPSLDPTNWANISRSASAYLKVSDRKAAGTHGGAAATLSITQTRMLNTVEANEIPGASLASNTVTLPAGTYQFRGRAPAAEQSAHRAFLYNVTDATYPGFGSSEVSASTTGISTSSMFSGKFTIAAPKNFTIRHWTGSNTATYALGVATGSSVGQLEVYSELEFWKVD